MDDAEVTKQPVASSEVAGWHCRWSSDPDRRVLEVTCRRLNCRHVDIGDPIEARLHIEAGPRRVILVQHRIWVVHDPAERQRMRWGEEVFASTAELEEWLKQVGFPSELAGQIATGAFAVW